MTNPGTDLHLAKSTLMEKKPSSVNLLVGNCSLLLDGSHFSGPARRCLVRLDEVVD